VVAAGAAALLLPALRRDAGATVDQVADLVRDFAGTAPLHQGKVKLDVPVLVENGNAVPMTVSVDAPPDQVKALAVFATGNPLPEVLRMRFGPHAGVARISTRIRLADSQTVVAVARLADGTCWQDSVELLVTLAACIE